jgi:hypothetical protein
MKKGIFCECCHREKCSIIECDTCGQSLMFYITVMLDDSTTYHFCDYNCLLTFINAEIKKES